MAPTPKVRHVHGPRRTSIEWLDITDQDYRLMVSRYQAIGTSLDEYWDSSPTGGEVYPQGSMRLGTITRNIHQNDDIDIDLVARRDLTKTSVTQAGLKEDLGAGLDLFIKEDPEHRPRKVEGKRCWTLQYPGFHVDVLPAVPDEQARGTGISITDTKVRTWLPSNPIGFANWFHSVMREEHLALIEKRMAIAPVPEWSIKTTLQRTVQALKRHRDIYFTGQLEDRPASVIITTLAGHGYTSGGSLYDVLRAVTAAVPGLVQTRNGIYVVSNPVQPKENFADRWRDHPRRAARFFEWAEQAAMDFARLGETRGVDTVLEKMARAFGEGPTEHAQRTAGSGLFESRRSGRLAVAAGTGMLATTGSRPVRDHSFYGAGHAGP
jgi:hypothetical protein